MLFWISHLLTLATASEVGMQVNSEVTSYETTVSSESNFRVLILPARDWELLTWCSAHPTREVKMHLWSLAMLYVVVQYLFSYLHFDLTHIQFYQYKINQC